MYDIIIIGGGCAGLTAAIYASRAGKTVLVIESDNVGGQITSAPHVENYPGIKKISGMEFADNLFDQALSLGVTIELEMVVKIKNSGNKKMVITEDAEYTCKSIIIATGVKHRRLGLEKEEELIGNGVSYCAVCDGAFFKNKNVAVVGGGNTALQDAIFLSAYCRKVFLIHRREQFRADAKTVEAVKNHNKIELILHSEIVQLNGEDSLQSIEIYHNKSHEKITLEADGLFVAIGQIPSNGVFKDNINLDSDEYVIASEDCKTSEKGIFAAGDCRTKQIRQLTTAAADGAVSALAACHYIDEMAMDESLSLK